MYSSLRSLQFPHTSVASKPNRKRRNLSRGFLQCKMNCISSTEFCHWGMLYTVCCEVANVCKDVGASKQMFHYDVQLSLKFVPFLGFSLQFMEISGFLCMNCLKSEHRKDDDSNKLHTESIDASQITSQTKSCNLFTICGRCHNYINFSRFWYDSFFFSSSAKHFFDKFQMLNSELHLFYPQNVELNKWCTLNVAH